MLNAAWLSDVGGMDGMGDMSGTGGIFDLDDPREGRARLAPGAAAALGPERSGAPHALPGAAADAAVVCCAAVGERGAHGMAASAWPAWYTGAGWHGGGQDVVYCQSVGRLGRASFVKVGFSAAVLSTASVVT